jgi:hypothetical protein
MESGRTAMKADRIATLLRTRAEQAEGYAASAPGVPVAEAWRADAAQYREAAQEVEEMSAAITYLERMLEVRTRQLQQISDAWAKAGRAALNGDGQALRTRVAMHKAGARIARL